MLTCLFNWKIKLRTILNCCVTLAGYYITTRLVELEFHLSIISIRAHWMLPYFIHFPLCICSLAYLIKILFHTLHDFMYAGYSVDQISLCFTVLQVILTQKGNFNLNSNFLERFQCFNDFPMKCWPNASISHVCEIPILFKKIQIMLPWTKWATLNM